MHGTRRSASARQVATGSSTGTSMRIRSRPWIGSRTRPSMPGRFGKTARAAARITGALLRTLMTPSWTKLSEAEAACAAGAGVCAGGDAGAGTEGVTGGDAPFGVSGAFGALPAAASVPECGAGLAAGARAAVATGAALLAMAGDGDALAGGGKAVAGGAAIFGGGAPIGQPELSGSSRVGTLAGALAVASTSSAQGLVISAPVQASTRRPDGAVARKGASNSRALAGSPATASSHARLTVMSVS